MENPLFGCMDTIRGKALVKLIFAAERGGSLTELAAAGFENATNFFSCGGYTHGTAAAIRRGSVVWISESCDVTELSGGFPADLGDKPFIRLSAGMVAKCIGSCVGRIVQRRVHDTGISFFYEYFLAFGKSDGDECGCFWCEYWCGAEIRDLYPADHGVGRCGDGIWRERLLVANGGCLLAAVAVQSGGQRYGKRVRAGENRLRRECGQCDRSERYGQFLERSGDGRIGDGDRGADSDAFAGTEQRTTFDTDGNVGRQLHSWFEVNSI